MPNILFIEHNGRQHRVAADVGKSLMQIATDHLVPGIPGDCGGVCSCATCHGYVDPDWLGKLAPKNEDEAMLLDGALNTEAGSRLTCQITMTEALDGLVVRLPASQF